MRKIVTISLLVNIIGLVTLVAIVIRHGGISNILFKLKHKHALAKMEDRNSIFTNSPASKNSIIFLGDSITEFGEWAELLPNHTVLNRGISGDGIMGVQNRIEEVKRHQAQKIFLMIGVNDLCFHSPHEVVPMYKELLQSISSELSNTQLIVQSILPVNNSIYKTGTNNDQIDEVNAQISAYCTEIQVPYINLSEAFKDSNNNLKKAFTSDGIHINGIAYKEWVNSLKPWLPTE